MEVYGTAGRRKDGQGKFPGSLYQARPPSRLIASHHQGRWKMLIPDGQQFRGGQKHRSQRTWSLQSEETMLFKKARWKGAGKEESLIGNMHSKRNTTPTNVPSSGQRRAGVTQANLTRGNVRARTCDDCHIFLYRILKGKKK